MTQDSFFFAIVPQAETETEPDTVSQPVAQCTRCETDAAVHVLADEDDGGLFRFCQNCFEEFEDFMQGVL